MRQPQNAGGGYAALTAVRECSSREFVGSSGPSLCLLLFRCYLKRRACGCLTTSRPKIAAMLRRMPVGLICLDLGQLDDVREKLEGGGTHLQIQGPHGSPSCGEEFSFVQWWRSFACPVSNRNQTIPRLDGCITRVTQLDAWPDVRTVMSR